MFICYKIDTINVEFATIKRNLLKIIKTSVRKNSLLIIEISDP